MKKILFIAFVLSALAAAFVYAGFSSKAENFKPAEDFPRDALVYVQVRDLPAIIKLWNDSELRRKYFESQNSADFQSNHLALKLAGRATEINFGLGIFPDLSFASSLSENKAALAVYDIGKIEFVFIAPMSEEKILASGLFKIQKGFEQIELDDEITVYSKEIDVDRHRQRQKVLFASFRGRLVLATSEKYFLQTLDNIKGKTPKNRLSNEPLFKRIAEKTKPNLATVWLNQQKLNDDWYFKHYWLMSETECLKNLRAGMFDFEVDDKKIIERRAFLTSENRAASRINPETARRIAGLIPENAQFYKIETAEKSGLDEAITDVLFDANQTSETAERAQSNRDYYFNDWEKSYSYSYLDNDFSEQIDETDDEILADKSDVKNSDDLTKVIGAANPNVSVKLFSPKPLPPPLFFDNRKALILSMRNPANLNPKLLESELANAARRLFTVNNQKSDYSWTDFSSGGFPARQMTMPALGWKIFYARRQNELIFSGSEDLLNEILAAGKSAPKFDGTFEKLTVINPGKGRESFDAVFGALERKENNSGFADESEFFVKNIGSLLDVVSDIERIEIKQTSAQNFLFEEIGFLLKEKRE